MNQAIHLVDLLLAVMGDPVSVHARTGRLAHERIEVEDIAVATVEFARGALGSDLGPAHALQLRDLVDVVRAREAGDLQARPRVGTPEGLCALALVLAMYESARTGRAVSL
jgi:predicted dehydrogenase